MYQPDVGLVVDTETTGIPDFKKNADDPGQPRVASVAAILMDLSSFKVWSTYYSLVQPDGWSMDAPEAAGAKQHNQLSDELLMKFGRPREIVFRTIADYLSMGAIFIAHSAAFDMKMLRGELRRLQLPDYYETTYSYCTLFNSVPRCGKRPKLSLAFETWLGKPMPAGAHGAMNDALACKMIYQAMKGQGADMKPKAPKGEDDSTMAPKPQSIMPTNQPSMLPEPSAAEIVMPHPGSAAAQVSTDDDDELKVF